MSLNVKIDTKQLRYILTIIKIETNKAYLLFDYDNVKIIFFNNDQTIMHNMDIKYESYFHDLKKNKNNVITIIFNSNLFFEEIDKNKKYKFVNLSIIHGDYSMKINFSDE
jgi:hypothetical protein